MSTISIRAGASPRRDPLTGLPNRQALLAEFPRLIRTSNRHDGIGALLLIDIERFRFINEVHGPEAGDELLCQVSRGLRAWADDGFIVARTGGDEFAIAFTAGRNEDVLALAHLLREALALACAPDVPQFKVGIATFACRRPPRVDALLRCATGALGQAKQDDAGWIAKYDVEGRWGIAGAEWMLHAIADDRLTIESQPIVDLATGEVVRHELLVRALESDGRVVMPSAFTPAAERFGLMPLIDRKVVARGLRLAAEGRPVSVNLSAQSTTAVGPLAAMVEDSIACGLRPENLMFEITETAAIADSGVGYRALRLLSDLGCPLALDDFGAGYGCFSYLRHIPAQVVKIDRQFIGNFSQDRTNLAVTMAVTHLARELGMEAVAEGIEDHETLAVVASAGVRYAQGSLLGRPAPIASLVASLSHLQSTKTQEEDK
jgi:diguanylate cyclase (GGDEF)-like protein